MRGVKCRYTRRVAPEKADTTTLAGIAFISQALLPHDTHIGQLRAIHSGGRCTYDRPQEYHRAAGEGRLGGS